MIVAVVLVVACVVGLVALRRRFLVVGVTGPSMRPALSEGDRVLVRRCSVESVRRGDVVVLLGPRVPGHGLSPAEFLSGATNDERRLMIKRVVALPGDPVADGSGVLLADEIVVTGDNAGMSFDSRQAGPFDAGGVRGVVVRRIGWSCDDRRTGSLIGGPTRRRRSGRRWHRRRP